MVDLEIKDQFAALVASVAAIGEQMNKLDGINDKVAGVEASVSSLEEVKPMLVDLALWKPKVDLAVGALQADLGILRVQIDRLSTATTTFATTPPASSPTDRRLDP